MSSSKLILIAGIALAATIIYFTVSGSDENYIESIQNFRMKYEESLQVSSDSPFEEGEFTGLHFYEPNPDFRVDAESVPLSGDDKIILSTSDGKKRTYIKTTLLIFELKEKIDTLTLLQNINDPSDLFLPFLDETSGGETYGTGRYLPVEPTTSGTSELDFNRAFNPYCAYNENYSCPMPPVENFVNQSVEAGEKNYAQHE